MPGALCDPGTDRLQSATIYYGLFSHYLSRGEPRKALELGTQLIRIGEHAGENVRNAGHVCAAMALWYLGRFRDCHRHLEGLIARYGPDQLRGLPLLAQSVAPSGHSYAAWADWVLGRPDRAWLTAMDTLEQARRSREPFRLAGEIMAAGVVATLRRDWVRVRSLGAETAELSAEQGFHIIEAGGLLLEVRGGEAERGDPGAVDAYAAAMARAAETGNQGGAPLTLGQLAALQLRAGRLDEAAATAEGALALAGQTGQPFWDAELQRQKGEISLRMPEHTEDEAEARFLEAVDIARDQEAKSLELRAATSLARLWQRQGKHAEARDLLQPVYDWFTEGFDTQDLKDAKALLADLG